MSSENRNGTNDRGLAILLALGAAVLVVHLLTGGRYGFHRDELATLDDARHLAWGYVAYPPVTPFFGWISLKLFGTSLTGFRFFAAVSTSVAVVFTGLMARAARRQDRRASACCCCRDSVRTRCRKSHAICFIRLFGVGRLFLLFDSAVQIARSAVVARNRRLHRFRHANQIQHAGLRACDRCRRAIYRSSRRFAKQMAMARCGSLAASSFCPT